MKNLTFNLIGLFILSLGIYSCTKEFDKSSKNNLKNNLTDLSAEQIGTHHNNCIDFVEQNIENHYNLSNEQWEQIARLKISEYILGLNLGLTNEEILSSYDQCRASVVNKDNFNSLNIKELAATKFETLRQINAISEAEELILNSFKENVLSSSNITNQAEQASQIRNQIEQAKASLHQVSYSPSNYVFGDILLEVARNSQLYWTDYNTDNKPGVAPWVAMDVLGAGLGGGSSLWSDYSNGVSYNWRNAAGQALI